MTWHSFYLAVFLFGFVLSVVTLLAGTVHLPVGRGCHFGHGGFHGPMGGVHGIGAGHGAASGSHASSHGLSPLNFATAMAFLAWFGGAGYLATAKAHVVWLAGLAIATAAGLVGGGIVFGFMTKVLTSHEMALDPADFEIVGALATVIVPIRKGGTGEISFRLGRTRRCAGARSDGPGALAKGAEVVVTRYEKGIAYVRPFETDEH